MTDSAKVEPNEGQSQFFFLEELQPSKLFPSLTAGIVTGIIGIIRGISYAAFIFSGTLSVYLNTGVGIAVFSTAVISFLVGLTTSLPGMIANPLAAPTAILAVLAAVIAQDMSATATGKELLLTIVCAIAISSLVTGCLLLLLGKFKLGDKIQFIPYPVVGGFMAGTGWILIRGAMEIMTDIPLSFANLNQLLTEDLVWQWLSGLCLALILLILLNKFSHFLIMPVTILGATLVFYLILFFSNTPVDEIRSAGWLLGPFPGNGLWQPLHFNDLYQVNWSLIIEHGGIILTVALISLLSLIITNNGIELAIGKDIDLNQELKAVGLANLVAGFGSGMVGNQALPSTILVNKMGASNRLAGMFQVIPCLIVLVLGSSFISYFPKPVVGSLIFYLGLDLLIQWLYKTWFKLPKLEYVTLVVVLLFINLNGFLEGIIAGSIVSVFIFVITYSKVSIVQQELSGRNYRSDCHRTPEELSILQAKGEQIRCFQLQGFIFFATCNKIIDLAYQYLNNNQSLPLKFLLIDFQNVSGLDSSAIRSFVKLLKIAQKLEFTLIFTHLDAKEKDLLSRGEALALDSGKILTFVDLNQGMEWAENQIVKLNCDQHNQELPELKSQPDLVSELIQIDSNE